MHICFSGFLMLAQNPDRKHTGGVDNFLWDAAAEGAQHLSPGLFFPGDGGLMAVQARLLKFLYHSSASFHKGSLFFC